MPILDAENTFSLRQSLAAAVGNLLCDHPIDTGAAGTLPAGLNARGSAPHDVGKGKPVEIECQINSDVTDAGGTSTIQAQMGMADDDAGTNFTVLAQTPAIAKATLKKGYRFAIAGSIPPGCTQEWLATRYVIAGEAVTGGTITANIAFPGGKQTA